MSVIPLTPTGKRPAPHSDAAPPDRGCRYCPAALSCPWRRCIEELPAGERDRFAAAYRIVVSELRRDA